jgi:hypothetical protein
MFIREKNLILNKHNIEVVREMPNGFVEVIMVSGRTYNIASKRFRRKILNVGRGRLARIIRWILCR